MPVTQSATHQARLKLTLALSLTAACSGFTAVTHAATDLSCTLGLLKDLGWKVEQTNNVPASAYTDTCNNSMSPLFNYNKGLETSAQIYDRAKLALDSTTTRCLVSRSYKASVKKAVGKLAANKKFEFFTSGTDPRDPFSPPDQSWLPAGNRGYDIPANTITESINALYEKPFVAECSAAIQIAQLATFKEHYNVFTDSIAHPRDVGIGIWPQFAKSPSMADKSPLLIKPGTRNKALRHLAKLGAGAFYGQSGYIKPGYGDNAIDSEDNRGQNFVIVDIDDAALQSLRDKEKPLKTINKMSVGIWRKYRRLQKDGADKEALSERMKLELEALDPFFRGVSIYVHPLAVRNFAFHLGRQFKWNPRTPFKLEIYEDYQSGYFHQRYIDYRLRQCMRVSYCRRVDRNHHILTDNTGVTIPTAFRSASLCQAQLQTTSSNP